MTIYTDGSVSNGRAGAGFVCMETGVERSFSLGTDLSAGMAEVFGFLQALIYLSEVEITDSNICILSDSKCTLNSVVEGRTTSLLTKEVRRYLEILLVSNSLTLLWVPSHSGILGNEIADRLSKLGAHRDFVGPQPVIGLPKEYFDIQFNHLRDLKHENYWKDVSGCRFTKKLYKHGCPDVTVQLMKYDRTQLRTAIGILTGHCLNAHFNRIGVDVNPTCRWCSADTETVEHVLCTCTGLRACRQEVFGTSKLNLGSVAELKVDTLLAFWKFLD
ncbi:uncharacterized protein LOC129790882 [Lutzomyia longipalpis]|uniref:uncharacterized protein LOC129790882 n=1 Tax=Lutzomyia longipalpis TaxID=7200 RepID=UPI0024842758|nr:uncharacterized protein LOC129790882 [Lutzomyia longipalpis]